MLTSSFIYSPSLYGISILNGFHGTNYYYTFLIKTEQKNSIRSWRTLLYVPCLKPLSHTLLSFYHLILRCPEIFPEDLPSPLGFISWEESKMDVSLCSSTPTLEDMTQHLFSRLNLLPCLGNSWEVGLMLLWASKEVGLLYSLGFMKTC